jgi:fibronectin type 3 domain-containing protein
VTPDGNTPTPGAGITYEEHLALHPPPPQHVRVEGVTASAVHLAWDPPPVVAIQHRYSDTVVAYRVYRKRAGELDFRRLAETAELTYTDTTVQRGTEYLYEVSSVHEHEIEGSRSYPPISILIP